MKVLIAVDTSSIYNHEERKKEVLEAVRSFCPDAEIDLVTFDKRGIVHYTVSDFMNTNIEVFMEDPEYLELFELMEEYDAQRLFTNYFSLDVLNTQLQKYAEKVGISIDE